MPSTLRQSLLAFLNIHPGEGRLVTLVLLYAILLYTANVLIHTASYALFLAEFGAAALPYTFVGVAVFASLVSFVQLKVNEHFSLATGLIAAQIFLLLSLAAYWLGLFAAAPWLIFSLPIYYGVNTSLTLASFWNLLGRLYSLQQGKRLFGLLSSGENIATIAAGFLAPALVAWLGTPNLFLVAAVAMAAALGVLIYLVRANAAQMAEPLTEAAAGGEQKSVGNLLGDRYIRLIISLFVVFIIGICVVDNIFYSQAEIQYPDQEAFASFIGLFFGVYGMLSLILQLFVTGRILGRFGVQPIILATPAGLAAVMLLYGLTDAFTPWQVALFWLASAAEMYRLVLDVVDEAAANVVYQPLPARQRTQAQTLVNGIVYPLSIGFTGLALLFVINILGFGPVQLAYLLLPLIALWLALGVALGRAYPRRLQAALSRRSLGGLALAQPDRSSLAIFRQSLASPQVGVVLYALDMLAELAPERLADCLPELLGHAEREIRLETLRRVEQLGLKAAIPLVRDRLAYEGSGSVQAASLRTLAALGGREAFDQVFPYLEHPDLSLRQGAVVGLLRSGELEGILLAGEQLLAWVRSPRPAERELAAQSLGEGGIAGFYRPLITLLQDDQSQVQRAALAAAGKLKHPTLWPPVTACLVSPQARSAALAALIAGGAAALPALEQAFAEAGQSRDVLIRLARVCGRIGGAQALALLRRHLDWPDLQVRAQILAALNRSGYRADDADRAYVHQALKDEAAQAAWTLAGLIDLEDAPLADQRDAIRLLSAGLGKALARQRDRLLLWLCLIYDPQTIQQVRDALTKAGREDGHIAGQRQDYALEVLEVLLPAELRAMLRPLIEVQPPAQRLQRLSSLFPQPHLAVQERLVEIIRAPAARLDLWTKLCALEAVGQSADIELAGAVVAALDDPDPLVRESAAWALARQNAALYQRHAATQAQGPGPPVARAISSFEADYQRGKAMLMLVERVLLLKAVDLFAEASEEVLAEAAATLAELEVKAGDMILAKDERTSAMYLVVEGQVSLQNGDRTSTSLGEQDVFGELALLNPAPQPIAVMALTDARLLRLDQAPLFELLEDHPPLAWGIIQRLAQRLQRTSQGRAERARDDLLGGLREKLVKKV